jgi:hypothetical protein
MLHVLQVCFLAPTAAALLTPPCVALQAPQMQRPPTPWRLQQQQQASCGEAAQAASLLAEQHSEHSRL